MSPPSGGLTVVLRETESAAVPEKGFVEATAKWGTQGKGTSLLRQRAGAGLIQTPTCAKGTPHGSWDT